MPVISVEAMVVILHKKQKNKANYKLVSSATLAEVNGCRDDGEIGAAQERLPTGQPEALRLAFRRDKRAASIPEEATRLISGVPFVPTCFMQGTANSENNRSSCSSKL